MKVKQAHYSNPSHCTDCTKTGSSSMPTPHILHIVQRLAVHTGPLLTSFTLYILYKDLLFIQALSFTMYRLYNEMQVTQARSSHASQCKDCTKFGSSSRPTPHILLTVQIVQRLAVHTGPLLTSFSLYRLYKDWQFIQAHSSHTSQCTDCTTGPLLTSFSLYRLYKDWQSN